MTAAVRLAEVIASGIVGLAFAFTTTSLMITMTIMMLKYYAEGNMEIFPLFGTEPDFM